MNSGEAIAPALVDGQVFSGSGFDLEDEPTLYGYDTTSGEQLWKSRQLGDTTGALAVGGETGFVSSSNYPEADGGPDYAFQSGVLSAVDLSDGSVKWQRETEWWHGPPVASGNDIVILAGGIPESTDGDRGRIRAYDAESSDPLWTVSRSNPVDVLALVGSTVYVGSRDGTVSALQAA